MRGFTLVFAGLAAVIDDAVIDVDRATSLIVLTPVPALFIDGVTGASVAPLDRSAAARPLAADRPDRGRSRR